LNALAELSFSRHPREADCLPHKDIRFQSRKALTLAANSPFYQ